MFKQGAEAYEVLSNDESRAQYDRTGASNLRERRASYEQPFRASSMGEFSFAREYSKRRDVQTSQAFIPGFEFVASYEGAGGRVIEAYYNTVEGRRDGFFWQPNGSMILHHLMLVGKREGQGRNRRWYDLETTLLDTRAPNGMLSFQIREGAVLKVGNKVFYHNLQLTSDQAFREQFQGEIPTLKFYNGEDGSDRLFVGYDYNIYKADSELIVVATPIQTTAMFYYLKPRVFGGRAGELHEFPLEATDKKGLWKLPNGNYIHSQEWSDTNKFSRHDFALNAFMGRIVFDTWPLSILGADRYNPIQKLPQITEEEARKISLFALMSDWLEVADTAMQSPYDGEAFVNSTQFGPSVCNSLLGGGTPPPKRLN